MERQDDGNDPEGSDARQVRNHNPVQQPEVTAETPESGVSADVFGEYTGHDSWHCNCESGGLTRSCVQPRPTQGLRDTVSHL